MICRLCLYELTEESTVSLFETEQGYVTIELIARCLQLEITADDIISTSICTDCYKQLQNIQTYCIFVDQRQSSLTTEFTECVKDWEILETLDEENTEFLLDLQFEPVDSTQENETSVTNELAYGSDSGTINNEKQEDDVDAEKYVECAAEEPIKTDDISSIYDEYDEDRKEEDITENASPSDSRHSTSTQNDSTDSDSKDVTPNKKKNAAIPCHICNKPFRTQKWLQNHLLKHKNKKESICGICDKSFLKPYDLRRHITYVHGNTFPFQCEICGKQFKYKSTFEQHMQEHQGIVDPPVQCDLCGEWFKNKLSLRRHRVKHEGSAKCHICGRVCVTKKALTGHIDYAHKRKRNLQCSFCDKSFKLLQNLEEHVAIHTGDQLYACPHCDKQSRSRANMYAHIKRNHVEEWMKSKKARSYDPTLKLVAQ